MPTKAIVVAVASVVFFLGAAPTLADDYCSSLRGQLNQLPVQADEQRYLAALEQLGQARTNYNRLYGEAQGQNCFALFQRFAGPQCSSTRASLAQQQRDIANLERQNSRGKLWDDRAR